jgi:hypothetical protein
VQTEPLVSIHGGNSADASAPIVDLGIDQDEVRRRVGKLSTNKKNRLINRTYVGYNSGPWILI